MTATERRSGRARVAAGLLLVVGLLPVGIDGGVGGRPAAAELIQTFTPPAFVTNTTGAIDIVGNAVMTCGTSAACVSALAGTNNSGNGSFTMIDLDADNGVLPAAAANQTVNSSAAVWAPPAGSTVLYASLHWSSQSNAANRNQMSFLPPGAASYQTVTGAVANAGSLYQTSADVTSIVQAAGPGTYWGGNVANTEGRNRYAAWSLVVVYENPTLPTRNLAVYDGFGRVTSSFRQLDVPISGFLTPPFGAVNAEIGVVAYEGDRNIGGDQVLIDTDPGAGTNFVNLTDASNPATNFGNGSISNAGVADLSGTPSTVNNLSIDIDEFATVNTLANGATDTTIRFQTTGDWWYPGVLTTAIDLFVPEFPDVTKTVVDLNGGDAVPGDILEYTLDFVNVGNDAAVNAVVTDPIPPNTTFVPGSIIVDGVPSTDAAGDDVGEFDGTNVIGRVGTGADAVLGGEILPDGTATLKFQVTVETSASDTTIENTAELAYTADTLQEDFTFDTNTTETPVPPLVDLRVVKSGAPDPVVPGEPVTWTVEVFNDGPNTATGVTVAESLTNSTFVSVSGASCPGAVAGDTSFSCDLADIAANASVVFTIIADTDPSLTAGTAVANTAIADSNEDDDDPTNNSGSARLPVDPVADLSITKSDDLDPARPGQTVTYTLTVVNDGPSDAHNVQISDAPPAGVTVTGVSLVAPAVGSCVLAARTCTLPVVAAGATVEMEVTVTIDATTVGTIVNAARVGSEDPDPTPGDNSITEETEITPVADISVVKTTLDAPVVAGEQVTYQITVSNAGPSTASAVEVSDTLDPALTLVSAVPTQGSCPGTGPITCNLGSIASGASADIIVTADVAATASQLSLVNTATATSPTDTTPGNNTGSVTDTVANSSDLRMIKEVDANPIVAGGTFEYTLTVVNDGPSATDSAITVTDNVPAPLVVDSVSVECGAPSNNVTCTSNASLAVGDSLVFLVSGTVPPGAVTPTIANTATVSYPNDPNPANDSATAETDLATEADVKIDKEWTSPTATAGGTATFTLEVTNDGPSAANNVIATDVLPAGLTFISAAGGTCTGTTTVTCTIGDMALDDVVTVTITVQLPDTLAAGLLANSASSNSTADGDPATDDRNPSNNNDTDTIEIVREADLQITKQADDVTPVAGDLVTYTVVVTNDGPSTANSTFVGDPLPAGLTLQSAGLTSSQGTCSVVAGAVSCDLGVIAVGAADAVTITYVALVDADVADGTTLTNTATATSTDPDPTPATVDEDVDVVAEADLTVTKTATPDPATPGGTITYTIVVENEGLSDAQNVAITDPPPTGFTPTSATATLGTCDLDVDCVIGTLAAGAQTIITITGDLATNVTGDVVNTTDAVTSDTTLVNTADDVGTATVETEALASLEVTKSASPTTIDAGGGPVTFIVTVANSGPSDAVLVDVSDTLPVGYVVTSVTPSQGSCATNTSCQLGTVIANDTPVTITYVGSFPSTQTAGTVTNSVSATSPTDPDGPVEATADVDITTAADVSVLKSGPAAVVAGDSVQYTIAVQNAGPSVATDIEVLDTLDNVLLDAAAATVTLSPPAAGTCVNNAGTIDCDFASFSVGALATITINAPVRSSAPIGVGTLANTATATASTDDPDATNDTSTTETDVNRSADLSVVKTKPAPAAFTAGELGTYQIVVTNDGPSDADAVVVSDAPPLGVTFGAVTSSPNVCTSLPCNVGTLTNGSSVTITIEATVDDDSTDVDVENTAEVTSPTPDGDSSNNASTITNPIETSADLVLESKDSSPDPVAAGETLTYTIVARNDGPSVAVDAVIVDTVPANTTLVPGSLPAGCTTTGNTPGSIITCELGDVAVGATPTVAFDVIVDSDLAAPATLSNTATTSSDTPDPDPANDAATEDTTVGAIADVGIAKTADLSTAVPGEELTYTLTLTNAGPSTARDVEVTDNIAAIFDAGTVSTVLTGAPAGATCDNTVACGPFDFPVGTFTVDITGTVSADILATLNNSADITTTTPETDGTLPNSATLDTPVAPSADLTIVKIAMPDPVDPSGAITYTITVTNNGSSDAQNVVVTDALPTDVALGTITSPTGTCDPAAVSCTYATIAAGDAVVVTITGTVSDRAVDTIENTASVTSDTPDPTPGDNTTTISTDITPFADVQLVKTTITSPLVAGETVRFTIDVFNNGPAAAADVEILDALPAGAAFVNASTPVGTCAHDGSLTGGTLDCDLGTLPDQAVVQITVDMLIEPDASGDLVNAATATSSTQDPDPSNNDASNPNGTTTDPIVTAPDLRILKTLTDDDLTAGEPFEYVIEIFNDGPSDALGDITVTDTLPVQVVPASVVLSNTTDCTFDPATRLVNCVFSDDLEVGGSISLTITGDIDPAVLTVDVNSAQVSTTDDDPDLTNNEADAIATLATNADLVAAKTFDDTGVIAGETTTFTISVTNNGPSVAVNTQLVDNLPADWTIVSFANEVNATCTTTATSITCDNTDLAVGATMSVEVTALVGPSVAAGPVNNTATASSDTPDRNPSNNDAVDSIGVTRLAQLSIDKSASADTVIAGNQITYTITVSNAGPSTAESAVVGDALPLGLTIVPGSLAPFCTAPGNIVTCNLGDILPSDPPISFTYTVTFDPAIVDDSDVTNTANATTITPQGEPASDDATVNVETEADLQLVSKTVDPNPGIAGQTVSYTITVINNGPSVALNTVISDDLPPEMTAVGSSLPAGCSIVGDDVECALGTLAVGVPTAITFDVLIDEAVPQDATLRNTASVGSDTTDPDDTNDSGFVDVGVDAVADVTITKSANPVPAVPGEAITYTLTVTNLGPSNAQDVVVADTTLSALVPTSIVATSTLGTCDTTVECVLGEMAPGTHTVTITGTVAASVTESIDNTASVATSTTQPDGGEPDSSTITTPVAPVADLAITKTLDNPPAVPGAPVQYTITVTNPGPSDSQNVVITDSIDPAVSLLANDQALCDFVDQDLTCNVGTLAPGTFTVVVSGLLDQGYTGTLSNTAGVTTTTPQGPNTSPDTATVEEEVLPQADLSLVKIAEPDPVIAGEQVTYTITVTNEGPSTAIAAEVDDILPAGLTLVSVVSTVGGCTAVPCLIGDIPAGEAADVTIVATVDTDALDLPANTATTSSDTADPDLTNNEASADPEVITLARLSTAKSLTSGPAIAGEPVTWTITVDNAGPSDALAVSVADSVPANLTDVVVSSSQGDCTTFDCALGTIPALASASITVTGELPADTAPGTIENTATTTSLTPDDDPSDDTATASDPTGTLANLSTAKALTSGPAVAGEPITWTITVDNAGPSDAVDVSVADSVPSNVTDVVVMSSQGDCTSFDCALGTISALSSATITVTGELPADTESGTIENTATTTSSTPDDDPSNDTATASDPTSTSADLSIDKTGPSTDVLAGRPVSWTITVSNAGPSDAQSVVITDSLPTELDVATIEIVDGGATCTLDEFDLSCAAPTIADGESVSITINAVLRADVTVLELSNEATVQSSTPDPDATNDSSTAVNAITDVDLSIVKTADGASVGFGDDVTFTIRVTNDGTSLATPIMVTDNVPAGLAVQSASSTVGTCSIDGNNVICSDIEVAPNGGTVDVTVVAEATGNGVVANVADLTCDCLLVPITSIAAEVTIQRSADLSVTKVADATTVTPGASITYTITVRNDGPDLAPGVTLTDRLPDGLTLTSSTVTVGTFDPDTGIWTIGDMADGDVATLTVIALATSEGVFTNVAAVDSDVIDPDASDDDDEATVTVVSIKLPATGGGGFIMMWWALGALLVGAGLWLLANRGRSRSARVT